MALLDFVEVDQRGDVLGLCAIKPESVVSLHDQGNSMKLIVLIETNRGSFRVKSAFREALKKINEALGEEK